MEIPICNGAPRKVCDKKDTACFFPLSMLSHFLFAQEFSSAFILARRLGITSIKINTWLTCWRESSLKDTRAAVSHCRWARANTRHCFSWIDFIVNPSCRLYSYNARVCFIAHKAASASIKHPCVPMPPLLSAERHITLSMKTAEIIKYPAINWKYVSLTHLWCDGARWGAPARQHSELE